MASAVLDGARLTLAFVEAQVGSLVDVLPVALVVTSSTGEIVRANDTAVELLANPAPLVGQAITRVVETAIKERPLNVRVRWLRHEDDVLRLYVIDEAEMGNVVQSSHGPLPGTPRRGV